LLIYILGATISLSALALAGCGSDQEATEHAPASRPVKTMVLENPVSDAVLTFPGKVRASQKADLKFQVAGRLIELPVKEGQRVEKGHLLAQLDSRDYASRLAIEKARYLEARAEYERAKDLYEWNSISRSAYDGKKSVFEVAEASLESAEKAYQDTYLRAPFAGVVAKKYVENFQNVTDKDPIVSLQDFSAIEIEINVPENLIVKAREEPVVLTAVFESYPEREFEVSLKAFGTEADPQTQTYPIKLSMPEPGDLTILPGMTASVTARMGNQSENTLDWYEIPVEAVFADEQGNSFVWMVERATMSVKRTAVELGEMSGKAIRVHDGFQRGDILVTAGVHFLRDGMKVRLLKDAVGSK